jgi:uncharacterized protein
MFVAAVKLDLFLSEIHSLKEKRMVLKPIQEKTFAKFKVPVQETDHQDLWQRAQIGFAVVGREPGSVTQLSESMVSFIESLDLAAITERTTETVEL